MEEPEEEIIEERDPATLLVARFFLYPLIIIGVICGGIFLFFRILLFFGNVGPVQRSPHDYLIAFQTGSECQRWQSAYELSNQVFSDKEKLDPQFVEELIAAYRSARKGDPRLRHYLAMAIGRIGDKRGVAPLEEGLEDGPAEAGSYSSCQSWFGDWFRKNSLSPEDVQVENQIYTLSALGLIGDNSAVPSVEKQLKHPDPSVRKIAAYVLGAIKDPSASHDLQIALEDPADEVKWHAAMALARLNDDKGADLLLKLLDPGYVDSVSEMKDQQKKMTGQQKVDLRVDALNCLALLRYEPAREKIAELSRSEPSLAVRGAALEALKKY